MLVIKTIQQLKKQISRSPNLNAKADLVRCMGDPTCLKILYVMVKEKEVCPSDVASILGISMPAVSHQLGRLKQMGIVSSKRMGQMICYGFSDTQQAKSIRKLIKTLLS